MNIPLSRARLLMEQQRFELAEEQLRLALMEGKETSLAHALLALCLLERDRYDEATAEAGQAIHDAPDEALGFYALASIHLKQKRLKEARVIIQEAIRLEPWNASHFGLLAGIEAVRYRWEESLAASEQGLACDPEDVGCNNLRAIALVSLGRKAEAGQSIEATLSRNPEDAVTHANQGWTLLHQQQPVEAMKHFREALRLEPNLEWARLGIIEAMKARFFVYRWLLTWFLWLSRFSPQTQFMLMLGLIFGRAVLTSLLSAVPILEPLAIPVTLLYVLFVWMSWTAASLFNLVLRLDPFGRLVLNRAERLESALAGLCVLACLGVGSTSLFVRSSLASIPWEVGLLYLGLMIPLVATFKQSGGQQKLMGACATGIAFMILIATYLLLSLTFQVNALHDVRIPPDRLAELVVLRDSGWYWFGWALNGIVISTWLSAGIGLVPQRRQTSSG